MACYILHHEGMFFEWSTNVDAPVSHGMTREEMLAHLQQSEPDQSENNQRLDRAEAKGSSDMIGGTLMSNLQCNRAGEKEAFIEPNSLFAYMHCEMNTRLRLS